MLTKTPIFSVDKINILLLIVLDLLATVSVNEIMRYLDEKLAINEKKIHKTG